MFPLRYTACSCTSLQLPGQGNLRELRDVRGPALGDIKASVTRPYGQTVLFFIPLPFPALAIPRTVDMSAQHFETEIPQAYFAALHAARAVFPTVFSHFKWHSSEEALASQQGIADYGGSLRSERDKYFSELDSLLKEVVKLVR